MAAIPTTHAADLTNGDFERGLEGWSVEGDVSGSQTNDNDVGFFAEAQSGGTSRIWQVFNLPDGAAELTFRYLLFSEPEGNLGPAHQTETGSEDGLDTPLVPPFVRDGRPAAGASRGESYQDLLRKRRTAGGRTRARPLDLACQSDLGEMLSFVEFHAATDPATGQPLGFPPDSFSAFLVDPQTFERLVPPPGEPPEGFEDFFFHSRDGFIQFNENFVRMSEPDEEGVVAITLDVTSLRPGREVRLEFGLAGGPDDFTTIIVADDATNLIGDAPRAFCRDISVDTDAGGGATVTVEQLDDGSFDPDGSEDIASLCITAVDEEPVDCAAAMPLDCTSTHRVTITITDRQGQSDSCTSTVTIRDATPPTMICPADIQRACDESIDPAEAGSAAAADNCDPAPSVSFADVAAGSCPLTVSRTWMATDSAGNSSVCVQVITIVDDRAPQLSIPVDATIDCTDDDSPAFTGAATAADICDPGPQLTSSDAVDPSNASVTLRTWTAKDACGNGSQAIQRIVRRDTVAPVITCPADIQVVTSSPDGIESSSAALVASAVDDCDSTVAMQDDRPAALYPVGVTVVTFRATDSAGNESTCSAQVEVVLDSTGTRPGPDDGGSGQAQPDRAQLQRIITTNAQSGCGLLGAASLAFTLVGLVVFKRRNRVV